MERARIYGEIFGETLGIEYKKKKVVLESAPRPFCKPAYGSPEVIKLAFFKVLQDFSRLSNRNKQTFQKLESDLFELEIAKKDPNLPGLYYLHPTHGVDPVIAKLS